MKKIALVLAFVFAVLTLAGCGSTPSSSSGEKKLEGTLEEILTKVYENSGAELPATMNSELTDENSEYSVGVARSEYKEGLVSDAMINAIAFSVAIMRTEDAASAESLAATVAEKANPRKWICVEAESVITQHIGDVVILIMTEENTAKALSDSFMALAA